MDDSKEYVLTAVELKPPHKLNTQESLSRAPKYEFHEEVVQQDTATTDDDEWT